MTTWETREPVGNALQREGQERESVSFLTSKGFESGNVGESSLPVEFYW
jgi:hypothetical protein